MKSEHGHFFAWAGFVMIAVVVGDTMICRGVSDDVIGEGGLSGMSEKIRGLEEQVRQLRKLVHEKTVLSLFSTIDGLPRDCSELYESGVTTNGVFTISPDGRCPFSVYCDMTRGGWTVIQRRVDGSVNFYRPWDDYVQGFGDVEGEHWLGLDKIHRLTSSGSQIHFQLGELFAFHDNMMFSTFDRDNDKSGENCCEKYGGGGGWWYKDCFRLGIVNGIFEKRELNGIGIWDSKYIPYHRVKISMQSRRGMCT